MRVNPFWIARFFWNERRDGETQRFDAFSFAMIFQR